MTLDITKPIDRVQVSELPSYIREDREAIESVVVSGNSITTTVTQLSPGTTILEVGVDLSAVKIENIIISGLGASIVAFITKGTAGQIKTFIFQDADITLQDGVKSDGKLYLNQIVPLSTFSGTSGDIISFINIGGDGVAVHGYWKELYRALAVK